jgi:1,5-anhydro-D-fructose reductase (1,5-anhydro-D-mannitol-forming)
MTHRVGIIGLGIMGQRMLGNMGLHNEFDVVSVFDPQQDVADVKFVDRAAALIKDPNVDLVYIACPPDYHAEYAIMAAKVGKPIFCEKPLGVDVTQSRDLVEQIEKTGIPNAVNFSFAANPARAFLKSKLADGDFGNVDAIDIRLHFATWPRGWQDAATWLAERKQGGYVREVLSHFIYLTESVFGDLKLEDAIVRYPDGPNGVAAETHMFANLSCGAFPVSVAGGVGGTGPDRVEYTVWGQTQSCRLDDWYTVNLSDGSGWTPAMTDIDNPRQVGRIKQLDHLAAFMRGEAHELPNFRAALSVQEIIEGILQGR